MSTPFRKANGQTAELVAVLAVLALNIARVRPFAAGTLLFVFPLGWLSMRLRHVSWRDAGLTLPARWPRAVGIGVAAGVLMQLCGMFIQGPIMKRAGVSAPDVTSIQALVASGWKGLALMLLIGWIVGALLEEMTFRGYLLKRVRDALGGRMGTVAAIAASSLYFGLSHWYQGTAGVIDATIGGLGYGVLFVLSGGNLLVPMLAHGAFDTFGIALLAAGYTGW